MLKGIKSWFFVEAEEEKKKSGKKTIREAVPAPTSKAALPENTAGNPGAVSDKFVNVLFKALRDNDTDGFDYMELKKSLQSLKKMEMDEATRFKSAYAMAQTMGVSKTKLIESARFYISVLKKEEQKFEVALSNQQEKQIGAKQGKMQQFSEDIKKKEAHIKKLQDQVAKQKEQINTLQAEIKEAGNKIVSTKNDFIASYNSLVNQIQQDIDHIEKHIQ